MATKLVETVAYRAHWQRHIHCLQRKLVQKVRFWDTPPSPTRINVVLLSTRLVENRKKNTTLSRGCGEGTIFCNKRNNTGFLPITIWGTLNQINLREWCHIETGSSARKNYPVKRTSTKPFTTAIRQEMQNQKQPFTSAVNIQEVKVKSINSAEEFKHWFSCWQCGESTYRYLYIGDSNLHQM